MNEQNMNEFDNKETSQMPASYEPQASYTNQSTYQPANQEPAPVVPQPYFKQPAPPQPWQPPHPAMIDKKDKQGAPAVAGIAFAAALLGFFLTPYRQLAIDLTYVGYGYSFFLSVVAAALSVIGLIFAPIGMVQASRKNTAGRALSGAALLLALVGIILFVLGFLGAEGIIEMF